MANKNDKSDSQAKEEPSAVEEGKSVYFVLIKPYRYRL